MHIYACESHKRSQSQQTVYNLRLTFHRHLLTLVQKVLAHSFSWWLGNLAGVSKTLLCSPSLLAPGRLQGETEAAGASAWPRLGQAPGDGEQSTRVRVLQACWVPGWKWGHSVSKAGEHPPLSHQACLPPPCRPHFPHTS